MQGSIFYVPALKTLYCSLVRSQLEYSAVELYEPSLDIVLEFKDLGLLVSYNLSWNSHINHIVSSVIRMLGLISHTCKGLFVM